MIFLQFLKKLVPVLTVVACSACFNANMMWEGGGGPGNLNTPVIPVATGASLSISSFSSAIEGSNVVFVVALNGLSEQDVMFSYQTVDETAAAGNDYSATLGTATIPAGSNSVNIVVPTTARSGTQGERRFSVKIFGSTNAEISLDTGVGSITDDNAASASAKGYELNLDG